MNIRIGNGYDIHRLVTGRPLILGGVEIAHTVGLLGHSDADVLTHAIMDAMLGALSLGDIIIDKGWHINNIDSVIVAEKPKMKSHLSAMRTKLAETLKINPEQVGIKATTNEQLGPVGREEGIAVYAVVLLVKD
ncbi:MAG: 2-C-methyl-D-erythritol 2,4-cyclodiphosphate synthase [Microcystis aeruginosa LL13-03]|nr:2-C-methyl-D-erythritol 2,4-cyclodiphosphate synthase [Microcystis aeruginosa LL13-03]